MCLGIYISNDYGYQTLRWHESETPVCAFLDLTALCLMHL